MGLFSSYSYQKREQKSLREIKFNCKKKYTDYRSTLIEFYFGLSVCGLDFISSIKKIKRGERYLHIYDIYDI